MSQRYLQERSLFTHRQVHGCTLCSRKGWSAAAEGHALNNVALRVEIKHRRTHIFAL